MKRTINLEPEREKAVLVKIMDRSRQPEEKSLLDEMLMLAETAELDVMDKMVQYRAHFDPATCLGRGKVEDLAEIVRALKADTVVFDNELSPAQVRNLEKLVGAKVVDRSELILDIFARHARTRQARTQVELAQLEYSLPRLKRMWTHLSRIKGGIGFRGPGEKQLEVDRRMVRKQIAELKRKLAEIKAETGRRVDARDNEFTVSLVGYTNAGKSTLMNALTEAHTMAANQLFATLDTLTRVCDLGEGKKALLSDTVGFIRDLPHHLIDSFHATLSEAERADLLLHVVDASHPQAQQQIKVVEEVLKDIGCEEQPTLLVMNKIDAQDEPIELQSLLGEYAGSVAVSALEGTGIEALRERIREAMTNAFREVRVSCPWSDGKTLAFIRSNCEVLKESAGEERCEIRALVNEKFLGRLERIPGVSLTGHKTEQEK